MHGRTPQNRCRLNEGRIARQEKMIEDLREKSLQLHAQLLHDNITFYNISEDPSENVIAVLQDFMFLEMKMTEDDARRVSFTKAYIMGEKGGSMRTRGIMTVVDDIRQGIIWNHAKNLKG